ncbi:MAG: asparagine synthase (glutamine-hydrolyzing) [Chitinophagales bacterium]
MCGIAGFVDLQLSTEQKKDLAFKQLRCITHRGPEASNVFVDGPVALGHNRLKIIDLSDEANQPFEYDDLVMAFNGEVYNYVELKADLEAKGYRFRTHGDTEVMCAAYKQYGEECVKYFTGMWAFALWDKTKQKLFCSRDRFGIKPFYYILEGQNLYFASEYKALKELPVFKGDINTEQVNRGLQMVWSVYRDQTFYTQVKNLQPAHNLVWQAGKVTINRYWDINFSQPQSTLTWEEKKEQFYSLFKDSVRLHARSDVPNGTCLSGGLDSSAISSMYSTLMPDTPIKSFSIYYEEDVDERPFIYEVVKKYPNIQPHYFSPTEAQIADNFHKVAYHADVPLLGSSFISQFFLMQLAKQEGVTVAIDGQGSDEYLGGYLHSFYRVLGQLYGSGQIFKAGDLLSNLSEREHFSAKKKRDFLLKSIVGAFSNENRMYNLEYGQLNKYLQAGVEELSFEDKSPDKFSNFLYHILLNTTLQTLLHFEDRNSMAFSLESRVPFLEHKLVEFAFTLPCQDKINDKAETKFILREALKPVLPTAVYERKDKKGFVTPGEVKWLNGPLKFLLDIDYNHFSWMKQDKLKEVVDAYKKGDTSKAAFVWRLACTNYWLKHFA